MGQQKLYMEVVINHGLILYLRLFPQLGLKCDGTVKEKIILDSYDKMLKMLTVL
jgi:hypothetical protein